MQPRRSAALEVALRLSGADVTQIQAALTSLLSPLDFESIAAWRRTTRVQVAQLLRCEKSASLLPIEGEAVFETDITIPVHEYAHYNSVDPAGEIFRALGDNAFIWPTLRSSYERPSRDAWIRSEFYNDWVRRQGLCQPCGLIVVRPPEQLPSSPFANWRGMAGLWFYWPREGPNATGERELAILRLLLPAFKASLHLLLNCTRQGERVAQALGAMGTGAVVVNEAGRITYENTALNQLLRNEPEASRLRAACVRLGRHLLAANRARKSQPDELSLAPQEQIHTAAARYRLRGTLLGRAQLGPGPVALIVLSSSEPTAAMLDQLRRQYRLTQRELAVMEQMAKGSSNAEVAKRLGLSIHTVRRHVEHILMKLGVHSRAAIAAKCWRGEVSI